jgi:hypothetical protein
MPYNRDDGSFDDDDPGSLVVDIIILIMIAGIAYLLIEFACS